MAAATRSLRPLRVTGRLVAVASVAAVLLGGCSTAVEVGLPDQSGDPACTAAGQHWPGDVSSLRPVATSPQSPAVHAWGDPAVIARCGVATPGPSTDGCLTVNGIDWLATPLNDGTKFVTYGRSPALEVLVPKRYTPEGALLPVFTDAAKQLPKTDRHCS